MNQFNADDAATGRNRTLPPDNTPVNYDLDAMLKENPMLYLVLRVTTASTSYLGLGLRVQVSFGFGHFSQFMSTQKLCKRRR